MKKIMLLLLPAMFVFCIGRAQFDTLKHGSGGHSLPPAAGPDTIKVMLWVHTLNHRHRHDMKPLAYKGWYVKSANIFLAYNKKLMPSDIEVVSICSCKEAYYGKEVDNK